MVKITSFSKDNQKNTIKHKDRYKAANTAL